MVQVLQYQHAISYWPEKSGLYNGLDHYTTMSVRKHHSYGVQRSACVSPQMSKLTVFVTQLPFVSMTRQNQ